ncbi:hypothetical protein T439DRAFT_285539 [Meredithblackwellia eburnea MCA 4105]
MERFANWKPYSSHSNRETADQDGIVGSDDYDRRSSTSTSNASPLLDSGVPLQTAPNGSVEPEKITSSSTKRKPRRKKLEPALDESKRRHVCELCSSRFARPSALKIHTLTHTKEQAFTCPQCNRAFGVASNMRRHQRLHDKSSTETSPVMLSDKPLHRYDG